MKLKDGFRGEASVVLPKMIVDIMESDAYMQQLHVTDIGYYPQAANHYRERLEPIAQHILIVCVSGAGWVTTGGQTFTLSANRCFVIPAGQSHCYGADTADPWTIYWIHFSGQLAATVVENLKGGVRDIDKLVSGSRDTLFDEILDLLSHDMSVDALRYASSMFHHYVGRLCYQPLRSGGVQSTESVTDPVDSLVRYIEKNVDRHLSLADLAEFSGYSPSHLSAMFTARKGLSPISYCNLSKVRRACHLLDTTSLRLNQICFRIGMSDPYYFSRFFSKMMGMSPRDYRRRPRP